MRKWTTTTFNYFFILKCFHVYWIIMLYKFHNFSRIILYIEENLNDLFKLHFHQILTVMWPWANHLYAVCLSFLSLLISKVEIKSSTYIIGIVVKIRCDNAHKVFTTLSNKHMNACLHVCSMLLKTVLLFLLLFLSQSII